ncbi:B-cell linker protein isoform X10 [Larimichthys crocea]|uniref:B-cell linker protein isoform X10 n=1 Tax=Larimichthys crocea TaxID=215358 RepID=UPI0009009521|nr:B-cell linker protein isoform X10 [Larimichthys crocea]
MNLPSREECEGWDQAQVAFFLYKNKMQECAATVNKLKINGHRLLNLSDTELSKFSLIHQPQLQKIVQDIKKNDGSLLNKLRRLKSKPIPKVPARDYRDDDQLSEPDYDNDTYEDPHEDHDDSYEPPPRGHHQNFTTTPAASYPKGEYLDNRRNQPQRPPRKPVRPSKGSKQLPPEPTGMGSDDEDYINPDGNDDDNYIEPEENPPSNPMMHGMSKVGKNSPMLSTPLPERPPSPDVYEVPDQEENSMSPASRLCPIPTTQSHTLPPKPSPRITTKISPPTEPTGDDEYEVCDPHDSTSDKAAEGPPPLKPKPVPRERSPKPPVRPRPDLKPREFESRTLPVMPTEQKTSPKAFSLDFHKRPKIPLPHFTPPKPADKGSISSENGSLDQDKDADVYRKSWYASTCDRKTADDVLFRANKDGAFMVRKSSGQDAQQPYTLVVFYNGRVYNIPIRFIPTTQQYALGREKRGEEYFSSVSHIIENHQRNPLVLIDSQSNTKDATKLCFPVKP